MSDNIVDLLRKCRRGPQIIMQKDAGIIIANTGIKSGSKCLDAGAGSGFLSIMLGNIVAPSGRVTAYEIKKDFYENVKKNIKICGLDKIIKVKNNDAAKFTEKNLDLITLDMKNAEKMVKKANRALKDGGFLVVYSPQIEQQIDVRKEMEKSGFARIRTIENIQREWSSFKGYTHPHPSGVMHTGFLTFGRKKNQGS